MHSVITFRCLYRVHTEWDTESRPTRARGADKLYKQSLLGRCNKKAIDYVHSYMALFALFIIFAIAVIVPVVQDLIVNSLG